MWYHVYEISVWKICVKRQHTKEAESGYTREYRLPIAVTGTLSGGIRGRMTAVLNQEGKSLSHQDVRDFVTKDGVDGVGKQRMGRFYRKTLARRV